MRARAVMVCGTSSGAGKSFLATALARWYARRGLKVAPFKAQNMSNNARVVAGGEIGSAQYFQALAARTTPDVRMNPVLLKPERDTHSQVIVLGHRRDDLARMEWRARSAHLWPIIRESLDELRAVHDVVVIEGAGSAAEVNLSATDVVNMRVAEAAAAATLIVCDIDRGGAFAHLYGTFQLLPAEHRALIRGFVLNKFRGDASLLAPGPQLIESMTGVPTLAVLPLWREHGLPEEDGPFGTVRHGNDTPCTRNVVIVAYPHISNLDEFAALHRVPGLGVTWARDAHAVTGADLLILPGSKHVAADLEWLRRRGMDIAITTHLAGDGPTLAICGGLQMLGGAIADPHGVEGAAAGLGLLPLATEFQASKRHRHGRYVLRGTTGCWAALDGAQFAAYEIRHGLTKPAAGAGHVLSLVLDDDSGWQWGSTLAVYVHGLFESSDVMRRLFGHDAPSIDDTLDGLADYAGEHFGERALMALLSATAPWAAT